MMSGSVQTKGKKLYMVIRYTDAEGKQKQRWISTGLPVKGNRKAAEAMLRQWLAEQQEQDLTAINQPLTDYLSNWLVTVESRVKPSTFRGYQQKFKNQIFPYFQKEKKALTNLQAQDLERFYAYLLSEKGLSPTTVGHCHRLLLNALNDAIRFRLISFNPVQLAKPPKRQTYQAKYLNYSETRELISLFKDHTLEPVIKFISVYGVRRGEALGLCWDKVDFENNQITIARTMAQCTGKNILMDSTKNASSYRTMPMIPAIRDILLALKERREQFQLLFPENYSKCNQVFVWDDGTPITPNYLSKEFHRVVKNSHLPCIRLHDLRHGTASNLLANGFSVVEVQHWLGHSQPSTTLNIYSHVDKSVRQHVGERIADFLQLDSL